MKTDGKYKTLVSLTLLMLTASPRVASAQEAVQYWHHEWDEAGKCITDFSTDCTSYKVLDSSTSLSDSGEFGVGDNPE